MLKFLYVRFPVMRYSSRFDFRLATFATTPCIKFHNSSQPLQPFGFRPSVAMDPYTEHVEGNTADVEFEDLFPSALLWHTDALYKDPEGKNQNMSSSAGMAKPTGGAFQQTATCRILGGPSVDYCRRSSLIAPNNCRRGTSGVAPLSVCYPRRNPLSLCCNTFPFRIL